ncbi:MAG TPA: hydroxymethylbilane synthase [Verrucomicrobiae bacterium]|jgi:hydroxymethylbilane synthase
MSAATRPIFIATRGSALALAQAHAVLAQCRAAFPDQSFEIRIIKTTGDKLQTASLASAELPKGLFTKELEVALLKAEADLAVHSLKDLPTELPAGLTLGAVGQRADVRDVLIYRDVEHIVCHFDPAQPAQTGKRGFKSALNIRALPHGATLATSSTRRSAQALEMRPDLNVVPIRGNVGTRLKKMAEQAGLDAIILAAAGLSRLHFEILPGGQLQGDGVPPGLAATPITIREMLPCVGQAAIGIEVREGDEPIAKICAKLDHYETRQCVTAERAFLQAMGGGCQLAVAAYAEVRGGQLRMRAVSFLGQHAQRAEAQRAVNEAVELGQQIADQLGKGARGSDLAADKSQRP